MNDHPSSGPVTPDRRALGGVIPPLCTPLTEDRELDVGSLERLCGFLLDAGVDGLFVNGSTGELAYHTDELRLAALRVVRRVAGGSVPVLAGAVDMTTNRVIAQARAARHRCSGRRLSGPPAVCQRSPSRCCSRPVSRWIERREP